ncbi:RNA polymerase sigma factor [Streptomyces sp. NPDC058001]|uniref:RNA polymerase sigma factor n=1 Tax=Streptomyces sp. NPDC058001 TaxID=3346300 RepID=UPI0036E29FC5
MAAIAEGDRRAFEVLYRRYAPWLVARMRYRCADPAQLDDVVQEAFLSVWRNCAEGRQPEVDDVAGWLWRIASRRLVDIARKDSARSRIQLALHRLRIRLEPSAEEQVLTGVEFGDMQGALAGLPPDLRDVLQATVLDGLSTGEAAERLRIPPGTVKTRAMRARQRLRRDVERARRQEP